MTNNNEDLEHPKSEEVQSIIERMPTYWVKWVVLCVGALMGMILLFSFLIQYPDTVDGKISITATVAPVRLVANNNGRINIIERNNSQLKKGDVISYIESGANYKHVLLLESLLNSNILIKGDVNVLPDTLLLGDVNAAYNAFYLSFLHYKRLLISDIYTTMCQNLKQQIISDEAVIENLNNQLLLKKEVLLNSLSQLSKDSLLLSIKGISQQDYQRKYAAHLSLRESKLNLKSNQLVKQSEISRNKLEIQRIILEETENKEKAYYEFSINQNELFNTINLWKERNLQYAPIDGELEYLGFWKSNSFVQSGQELFAIIPDKNDVVGEVVIPSFGAGKVKLGQMANVKLDKFPYDEYGLLKGTVKSISRITNKVETANGPNDTYLVVISFPDGTVTNFDKLLPIDFETKGTVEIIIKSRRLIERLLDNLKSKGVK